MPISKNGFTLIELIVVIVIIAVLAVVAAPRFLDLNSDARESMLQGTAAELQQAINFAHQRWAVEGIGNVKFPNMPGYAETETEGQDGIQKLDMNARGYPLGYTKGSSINNEFNIGSGNKGCTELWDGLLDTSLTATRRFNQADGFDIYATRQLGDIEDQQVQLLSRCAYIYTKDGLDRDPQVAKHVIWYDSQTGDVSYVIND